MAQAKKKKTSEGKKKQESQPVSSWSFGIFLILIIVVLGLLCLVYYQSLTRKPKPPENVTVTPVEEEEEQRPDIAIVSVSNCLPVYFYDGMSQHFVPVHYPLDGSDLPVDVRAKRILEKILEGPPVTSLIPVMPPGTKLNSVKQEGDLMVVDLSGELKDYKGGSTSERLIVQSILLSLTELPGVKRVQLLIDGKKEEYLPQGTVIEEPMTREGGPNSSETVPEGKVAGYLYFVQKAGDYLTPVYWTWDGSADDPRAKLESLYSEPQPQLSQGLMSPAPPGLRIEKCEINNDTLTLIIDHQSFASEFQRHSPENFLKATILTMYQFKKFSRIDIRVGDNIQNRPIWEYTPFAGLEGILVPPECYNVYEPERLPGPSG
jgi:spore germination protein GerM